jgi:hypothetical protein
MRIHQKWGFGMAPVKPGIQRQRDLASSAVLSALEVACCPAPSSAADMSEVKGLFTRSYKQDQWDWFTVWTQLGRPGRKLCRLISGDLGELRRAVLDQDVDRAEATRGRLRQAGTAALLRGFLNPWPGGRPEAPGTGFVYILSTRTSPQLLKIGYTERTVEQRLKEINRGTGVAEPYGARAVWTVQNAPQVEKAVHETLAGYRVRADREFFELPYGAAYAAIRDIVDASRREL